MDLTYFIVAYLFTGVFIFGLLDGDASGHILVFPLWLLIWPFNIMIGAGDIIRQLLKKMFT